MIFVGIDDTDVIDAPGTNQLAKKLAAQLSDRFLCHMILRHQLLVDERVPYTSKNSSATLMLSSIDQDAHPQVPDNLFDEIASFIKRRAAKGSDPGLCIGRDIPQSIISFGYRCKATLCSQQQTHRLANAAGLSVAGLGGTDDGVIGAVAAVGLAASGDDGRVVMIDGRDDVSGICRITDLHDRRVEVRCQSAGQTISQGRIDVGKHLRPNLRSGRIVQYARKHSESASSADIWKAVRLP